MRFVTGIAAAAVLCPVLAAGAGAAAGVHPAGDHDIRAGTWGTATEVPGTAALNKGGHAQITSVSCLVAGDCTAGGYYEDGSGHTQAFVVGEKNGIWAAAEEVPGSAALNKGGSALIGSVSCTSAGNCTGGGAYLNGSGHSLAMVAREKNGTWGKAEEVPGVAALGGTAYIESVSCPSAGNCSADGEFLEHTKTQVWAVSETKGSWGTAKELPGIAALNKGGIAGAESLSCGSAGNCSAGGFYYDHAGHEQAFIVGEKKGTWGTVREVPGSSALNSGGNAQITSVSCASAGNCAAGGDYTGHSGTEAFTIAEKGGTWGTVTEVPGSQALNSGGFALITSVSCASAGDCGAGGQYTGQSGKEQAFVAGERGGTWGKAAEVPGIAALNKGGSAQIAWVSCASAGHCGAGGYYTDSSMRIQAFVVSET
jgi:hypothetical protein